jgi:predicted TIM-barrel fold metal-dependent hydrolase
MARDHFAMQLRGIFVTRLVLVSADSHVGLLPAEWRSYFESKFREDFDGYLEDNALWRSLMKMMGFPFKDVELDVIDGRGAIREGGVAGFYDPERRLKEAEAEGVVAEFLHPSGPISLAPFCDAGTRRVSAELRAAGTRAHNRFMAEYCQTAPGRLLGVAMTYPWPDMSAMAETVAWAKEVGMAAVFPPTFAGCPGDLPPLFDPSWDPFWAACEAAALPVHIHAGFGHSQGGGLEAMRDMLLQPVVTGPGIASPLSDMFEQLFGERRPLWQLMWGGVFDRFPRLKIVFAEIHGDWVPPTLAYLDARHAENGNPLRLTPSEYWTRHCAAAVSLMRQSDVEARHTIGNRLMWGSDFPHMEGTWPNTLDWLRVALDGVAEPDVRRILGENAIDFYGLDANMLGSVAERVGPEVDDIVGKADQVAPEVVDHFRFRAGFGKPLTFDRDQLIAAVDEDVAATARLRASV